MPRKGIARLLARGGTSSSPYGLTGKLQSTTQGQVCVAQALPPIAELVRLGESWQATTAAATPIRFSEFEGGEPGSTVLPIQLYNFDPVLAYVIDAVSATVTSLAGTPTVLSLGLKIAVLDGQLQLNPSNVGQFGLPISTNTPTSLSGRKKYRGNAVCTSEATQILGGVTAGFWHSIGTQVVSSGTTANLTLSNEVILNGRYIIPPGGIMGLMGLIGGTAATAPNGLCTVIWHEVLLPKAAM